VGIGSGLDVILGKKELVVNQLDKGEFILWSAHLIASRNSCVYTGPQLESSGP